MTLIQIAALYCFVFWTYPARAADPWFHLKHGDQHALFLGSVKSHGSNNILYKVITLISGQSLPEEIVVVDPKSSFYERRLKPGDLVVVSIDKMEKNYRVKHGTYKVDSENLDDLKVLEGPASEGDLQSLQKFFNSGGKIKDFFPGKEKSNHKNLDGAPK